MKSLSTGRENQRTDFVDSLYKSLRKKTENAISKHHKLCCLAASYLADGLSPEECAELLIIEGKLSRDAASAYINMAQSEKLPDNNLIEYSFQFEDINGKVFSSYDIGRIVKASSMEDAWEKAEEIVFSIPSVEPEKVISVDKVSNA